MDETRNIPIEIPFTVKYSPEHIQRVLELHSKKMSANQISKTMGIPRTTVRGWIYRSTHSYKIRPYTNEEKDFIRNNYSILPKEELLNNLDRSWSEIRRKAHTMGLKRHRNLQQILELEKQSKIRLTEFEKGYLAGIIDGEGTICISHENARSCYVPQISIPNTDIRLVKACRTILNSGYIASTKDNNRKHRRCYRLKIVGMVKIYRVLKTLEGCLISKREQAKIVLKYIELRLLNNEGYTGGELKLAEQLKELNRGEKNGR